jgi:hypothetical protein
MSSTIATEALMLWQTGYLTFHERRANWPPAPSTPWAIPTRRWSSALNDALIKAWTWAIRGRPATRRAASAIGCSANDFAGLEALFTAFFASIPA